MPILDVVLVGAPPVTSDVTQRIADGAADVFGSPPQGTWVTVRTLDAAAYAENGGTPEGVAPVFVSVLQAEAPSDDERAVQASRLAAVIGEACGRPAEHVHVLFEPPAKGRIAFGGRLLT